MAAPSLPGLPKELLRQICGYLPCQSALDFALANRFIHHACNDWIVWRAVATQSIPRLQCIGSLVLSGAARNGWKRYAVAAAKASNTDRHWTSPNLEKWLPQLAALCVSDVIQCDALSFHQRYGAMFSSPVYLHTNELELCTSSKIVYSATLHTWQLAQAAAFTMTMRYLSLSTLSHQCSDEALQSVPWLRTDPSTRNTLTEDETNKQVIVQHALANRVVGFLCARLRSFRAAAAVAGNTPTSAVRLPIPPSATTIPFPRQMQLPLPFAPDSLEDFVECHLPVVTKPTFFTDDTWTGFFSVPGPDGQDFNSVGGVHHDGFARDSLGLTTPFGDFPHGRAFEGVVRFHMVEDDAGDYYQLQSNNFYSEAELHRVRLTVRRTTGQVTIHHWHRLMADFMTTDGVVTPFGILSWLNQSSRWMWFWKTKWSAPALL